VFNRKGSILTLATALLVCSALLSGRAMASRAADDGAARELAEAESSEAAAQAEGDRAAADGDRAEADAERAEADTERAEADRERADSEAEKKDLDAQLADARKRLEEAAHEVAELSVQMGRPLVDKFMAFNEWGPSRAIIGVQIDPASGNDGARVQEVSPGGPAADAGMRAGDVIVGINGVDIKGDRTGRQVVHLMRGVAPDSKVRVRVVRDGKAREFVVTARSGPKFNMPDIPTPPELPDFSFETGPGGAFMSMHGPLSDMELASLTPQLGSYFGTDKGVLVVRAPRDGGFKLEDGDVILAIDGREPTSGSHATRILSSYQPGEKAQIKLMRQHKTITVESTLPERPSRHKTQALHKDEAPT